MLSKHVLARAALALAFLPLTACVTNRQFDDQVVSTKHYQTKLHEAEERLVKVEDENARLKKKLAQNDVAALSEAGYGDLDTRLSELQSKIDGLGRPLQDYERFDVEGGYVLLVADRLLFDSGSADLTVASKEAIGKIVADISAKPHGRIQVRGHTDSDPVSKPQTKERFPHGNLQLSAMRAVEVAAALAATDKVKWKDLTVAGFGQWDPLHKNDNTENKRLNRRVEIFVSDAAPAPAK